ncbi:MAG: hypothetical protein Q4D76_17025 [Oscillospiraceae bacterium]|nr:hypothetical protein [Oscillospiraceae bacterium]
MNFLWDDYSEDTFYSIDDFSTFTDRIKKVEKKRGNYNYQVDLNIRYPDFNYTNFFFHNSNDYDSQINRYNYIKESDELNILCHLLRNLEEYNDVTELSLLKTHFKENIIKNKYGLAVKECFMNVENTLQQKILYYMVEKNVHEKNVFYECVYELFENVIFYIDDFENKLLIFTMSSDNHQNKDLYSLIELLFKDIFLNVSIYWNTSPVIFDEKDYIISDSEKLFLNLI